MSAITEFYDSPDLEDGFGSTAGDRKNSHRGLDFPHALGTVVPSLGAGVVVTSEEDSALGCLVEVQQDDGRFVGYRHLRRSTPRVKVGERVGFGTKIGEVSDTGSAAFGYHLCTTNASAKGGVYGDSKLVTDPWPWIQHYVFGKPRPGSAPAAAWAFNPPAPAVQASIQRGLNARGRYTGPADGAWGVNTIKGIQQTIRNVGYAGPIDGVPGQQTCHFVQVYAAKFGGYKGPVDSILGPNSWAGFDYGINHD